MKEVRFPAIVKPRMEAVSFGLRLVNNYEELRDAVRQITEEFQQQALVEEFIPGREFAVGLLGNGPNLETLPIVEIDFDGNPNAYQSVDDKMRHPRQKICPAELTEQIEGNLRSLAQQAFESLGLHDFSRVDFRMDEQNRLYILEINSMASLNLKGSFVQAAKAAGMDFPDLVNRMIEVAAIRYFGDSAKTSEKKSVAYRGGAKPLAVRVRSYLRGHLPVFVDSLEKMVAIESFVNNIDGVNMLGRKISREFRELGFSRKVYPQVDVGDILYFSNHSEEQNDILILGHLDTAYDFQNFVPFHVEHGKIIGSGVAESKGGLVVLMAALRSLFFSRVLRNIRCGVLLTTDDTLGGSFSSSLIEGISLKSKYIVGIKFCDQAGGIVTSCAGSEQYNIMITNYKSPGSGSTSDLINSISHKVIALRKLSSPKGGTTVSISSLSARKNPGRISDHANIVITISYTDKNRISKLDKQIREIIETGTNGKLQSQIRIGMHRPPLSATTANLDFFEKVKTIARELEVRVNQVHREVPSDICHVPAIQPVLGGFGPIGGNRLSPHEFIIRDSIIDRSALLALVIHNSKS